MAATQFTASMAIMNLATTAGSALAGPIAHLIDVPTAFLIAGLLQPLAGLLLLEGDATENPAAATESRCPPKSLCAPGLDSGAQLYEGTPR